VELVGLWIIALIMAAEVVGGTLQDEGVFLLIFNYFDFDMFGNWFRLPCGPWAFEACSSP
jgi:hypothetical protein